MNRIDELFSRKEKNILSVFFTAGHPKPDSTMEILVALEESGADLVEIGMPFSDPLADGPVIQESSRIALENGMNPDLLFAQLKNMRSRISIPVLLMGYLNPVMQFGVEKFLSQCRHCGIDGLILPDLPPEVYRNEFEKLFSATGIYPIFLATPDTPDQRLYEIASLSKGFVYLVSSASTTGSAKRISPLTGEKIKAIRQAGSGIPVLTGFGIHDAAGREEACRFTNGTITGTAFIRELESTENIRLAAKNIIKRLTEKVYDHSAV